MGASSTPRDLDLGDAQVDDGALAHAAFAERGQDVGDVVEERPVRPDDEDAVARQTPAMLEHQIGGAVQGDGRLAGAGATLDDEHLIDRRSDDEVLLRLDRRHDLAHRPGAFCTDLGEHRVGDATGDVGGIRIVKVLVEVRRDLALVEGEPPAQADPQRVGTGCPVERCGDRRSPIDHHRVVLIVLDVPTPEIPPFAVDIDAAEEVSGAGAAQVVERLGDSHLDVLAGDLVGRALGVDVLQALDHPVTAAPGECEARPFGVQLGVHRGSSMLPSGVASER